MIVVGKTRFASSAHRRNLNQKCSVNFSANQLICLVTMSILRSPAQQERGLGDLKVAKDRGRGERTLNVIVWPMVPPRKIVTLQPAGFGRRGLANAGLISPQCFCVTVVT